jgi:hypothetical protein
MSTEIIVNEIDGNAVQTTAQGSREDCAAGYPVGHPVRIAIESVQPGESQIVEFSDEENGEPYTVRVLCGVLDSEPADESLLCGRTVQHDNSGVGHNWRTVDARDLPAKVIEEIEYEIIDNEQTECDDSVATNGLHYRWR